VIAILILVFTTFQLADVVYGLVGDSKISFNVTDFFSLDIFTVIGLIVLALLSLSYYYFTRLLFRFILPAFRKNYLYLFFLIIAIGLAFLSFERKSANVLFHMPILLWLVIYTLLLTQEG